MDCTVFATGSSSAIAAFCDRFSSCQACDNVGPRPCSAREFKDTSAYVVHATASLGTADGGWWMTASCTTAQGRSDWTPCLPNEVYSSIALPWAGSR
jgi:hypothetical protein